MIEIQRSQDLRRIRRLALASQGLLQANPYGHGIEGAQNAISQIGYVQIDTISVVERAHNHVLYSRVPGFEAYMTNKMLRAADIFEYWVHAAAFLPIIDFRFSLPYKHAIKHGSIHWYRDPDKKLMKELLARIRSDGPIRSRDLETDSKRRAGWWDWKPAKKALEQLYMQGDLMVCNRENFQKTYDLTERVLPSHIDSRMPTIDEFAQHIIKQQLRCHGLVSRKGLTYQRRNAELRKSVKAMIDEGVAQRDLELLKLNGGEEFIVEAGVLERPIPRIINRLLILSPFDNSVIQRERLRIVFEFDYQLECYLPASKRRFGYFCLPLLFRDTFIGRMDCKAHRKARHFEIRSLYLERHEFEEGVVLTALVNAVIQFLDFQECDSVSLSNVKPKRLTSPLRKALKSLSPESVA